MMKMKWSKFTGKFFNVKKFKTFEHEKVIVKNFNYKLMKGEKGLWKKENQHF